MSAFVVHRHRARSLHYDFRLSMGGVLKSWAVPKHPPRRAGVKVLAIQMPDHARSYLSFEGVIPKGEYGAGRVSIYDKGSYRLRSGSVRSGKLVFDLLGKKLTGRYALIRMKRGKNWLLLKRTIRLTIRDKH